MLISLYRYLTKNIFFSYLTLLRTFFRGRNSSTFYLLLFYCLQAIYFEDLHHGFRYLTEDMVFIGQHPVCFAIILIIVSCHNAGAVSNQSADFFVNAYKTSGALNGIYSSDWVPMTQSEALNYYTAFEICIAASGSEFSGNLNFTNKKCNFPFGQAGYKNKFHINTAKHRVCGNRWGHFLRHVSTKPWPYSRTFIDIVFYMHKRGSNTIVFMGDSLTAQHYADTMYAVERAGLIVSGCVFKKMFPFPENIQFPHGCYCYNIADKQKAFFRVIYFGIGSDISYEGYLKSVISNNTLIHGKVLFIANIGLHFHRGPDEVRYRSFLFEFLSILSDFVTQGHIVVFRESSAQHFHTPTGEYPDERLEGVYPENNENVTSYVSTLAFRIGFEFAESGLSTDKILTPQNTHGLSYVCRPIPSEEAAIKGNFRNIILFEVIHQMKLRIHVVPFYNITAARFEYHIINLGDCTHFCYGPMIWAPVHDSIYNLVINTPWETN